MTASNSALLRRFGEVRLLAQKRGQINIDDGHIVDPGEIGRRFEARKNRVRDLAARNFLFAVTVRDVARPVAHVFAVGVVHRPEKNDRVTAFASADVFVPKNFHEIAGLRLREIGEVSSKLELVKQTASSGAVGVPATPNPFAIVLIANHKLVQRGEIELELPTVAQSFDRFDENDVSRARAEARIRRGRDDKEFSRFKMRGGLQFDLGEVRDGIFPAARHLPHLLED